MPSPLMLGTLVLLGILPFWVTLSTSFPLFPAAYTLLLSILGLGLVVRDRREVGVSLPLLLFASWVLVETFRASVWHHSVGIIEVWYIAFLIGFLLYRLSQREPSAATRAMVLIWCVATAISALNPTWKTSTDIMESALEEAVMEESYKQAILHAAMQDRFLFPFGNPIHLGMFLTFSILCFPALFRMCSTQERPQFWRAVLLITGAVQLYVLWGTRARTSLLAFLCAGTLLVLLHFRKRLDSRLILGGVLVGFLALAAVMFTPAGREMLSRVETIRARAIYWEVALRMIRDYPALGLGVGGFGDHFPRYRPLTPHQTEFPHQIFLEAMTDWGAIGFLLFVVVLISQGGRLMRYLRRGVVDGDPSHRLFALWQVGVLVAFGLSAQVGFPHNKVYLVGTVAAILSLRTNRGSAEGVEAIPYAKAKGVWLVLLVPIFLLVTMRQLGQYQFERGKEEMENNGLNRTVYHRMIRAGEIWPPQWEAHYFVGRMLWDMGDHRGGLSGLDRAIEWNPTISFVREDKAKFLWSLGEKDEAVEEILEAIRLHPVKWQYRRTYSGWLHALGDVEAAVEERELSERLREIEPDYEAEVEKLRSTRGGA